MLKIENLTVKVNRKQIINRLNMEINSYKFYALMGQNGSGKSTLAQTIMGHPQYEVVEGNILFDGKNLLKLTPNERSSAGLFLSFQYPSEIPGVTISGYLRMIYNKKHNKHLSPIAFRNLLKEKLAILHIKNEFMNRYLNDGFSGGEKKRMEMLQMLVLEPKLAILDEIDSGLDIDALKIVAKTINYLKEKTNLTVLIITHYSRILKYLKPDFVYIMQAGKIVKKGNGDLALKLEEKGYEKIIK